MADREGETSRRRLLRRIGGGVALGVAGVTAGRLLFPATPVPGLLRGLPEDAEARDRAFAARVKQLFPAGTPESRLRDQLARQGFTVHSSEHRADWQRTSAACKQFAQVEWRMENGQVADTRAVLWQVCS
jgi:hypothetical protein